MEATRNPTFFLSRRIGSTVYRVNVYANSATAETLEDIIIHLVRNEALDSCDERAIMTAPQMSRQSERSAS